MVTEPLTYREVRLPRSLFAPRRWDLPLGNTVRRVWAFLRGDAYVNVFHDLTVSRGLQIRRPKRAVRFSAGATTSGASTGCTVRHYRLVPNTR